MRNFKKMMALALAMVMVLAMSIPAMAQTKHGTENADNIGSITIDNAARGETYKIYKLFEATIGEGDAIAYKIPAGGIPSTLTDYFVETSTGSGYLKATDAAKDGDGMSEGLKTALTNWAKTAAVTAQEESDGSALTFDQLELGYYVITTTQGDQAISVDSTQPNVTIYDKNTTTPSADKTVEETSYSIGDTINYTATFNTTNYMGSGADAKQVTKYKVSDTLPAFLSGATIDSIKVLTGTDDPDTEADERTVVATITGKSFGDDNSTHTNATIDANEDGTNDKSFFIPWATYNNDGTWTSLYPNGAVIEVKYHATLTSTSNIGSDDKNEINIRPYVAAPDGDDDDDDDDDDDKPYETTYHDDASIKTYAAALKKVDGSASEALLDGAEFEIAGVELEKKEDGVYIVKSVGSTKKSTVTTKDGMLYIVGLAEDVDLTVTETKAPDGYNKLTGTQTLEPQLMAVTSSKTTTWEKYDSAGNLIDSKTEETASYTQVTKSLKDLDAAALKIVNEKGTELPSTGGIGTTIFYIIGVILVLGAGILLVTRRRMSAN